MREMAQEERGAHTTRPDLHPVNVDGSGLHDLQVRSSALAPVLLDVRGRWCGDDDGGEDDAEHGQQQDAGGIACIRFHNAPCTMPHRHRHHQQ